MDKRTFDAIYSCVRRWWVNQSPILRESVEQLYPGVFDKFVAMYEPVSWMNEGLWEESWFQAQNYCEGEILTRPDFDWVSDAIYWGDSEYGE